MLQINFTAVASRLDAPTLNLLSRIVSVEDPAYVVSSFAPTVFSPSSKKRYASLTLPTSHACFGSPFEQFVLENVIGYDTCIVGAAKSLPRAEVVASVHSRFSTRLDAPQTPLVPALLSTALLFLVSTSTVSVLLRETQRALIKFSWAWRRDPSLSVALNHAASALVIAPATMGLFYIIRLLNEDSLLSFMLQALVWLCELFSAIVSRTRFSMAWFPRVYALCFFAFHAYRLLHPHGYSYIAFTSCVLVLQLTMYALWLSFEVPALVDGSISVRATRVRDKDRDREQRTFDARKTRMEKTTRRHSSARQRMLPKSPLVAQY